jgi:hypothetical protein
MAKLTKKQAKELSDILYDLGIGVQFIQDEKTAVCRRKPAATTVLDYTRTNPIPDSIGQFDNYALTEINKEAGSNLIYLEVAQRTLRAFLNVNFGA